jgi:hypothetical protein
MTWRSRCARYPRCYKVQQGTSQFIPPHILAVGVGNTRTSSDRSTTDVDDRNLASRVADVNARIIAHTMPEDGEDDEVDELVDELEGDGEEEEGRGEGRVFGKLWG